ncbi:hypothetical protein MTO96_020768 [Rhipicephalus appendiculatus]
MGKTHEDAAGSPPLVDLSHGGVSRTFLFEGKKMLREAPGAIGESRSQQQTELERISHVDATTLRKKAVPQTFVVLRHIL